MWRVATAKGRRLSCVQNRAFMEAMETTRSRQRTCSRTCFPRPRPCLRPRPRPHLVQQNLGCNGTTPYFGTLTPKGLRRRWVLHLGDVGSAHRPSLPKDRALSFEFLVMFSLVSFQAISVLAQIPLSIANTIYWSIGDLSSSSNNLPIANTLQKTCKHCGVKLTVYKCNPSVPIGTCGCRSQEYSFTASAQLGFSWLPPPRIYSVTYI